MTLSFVCFIVYILHFLARAESFRAWSMRTAAFGISNIECRIMNIEGAGSLIFVLLVDGQRAA
jgi:hypothetical protein